MILDEIAAKRRKRIDEAKGAMPLGLLKDRVLAAVALEEKTGFRFMFACALAAQGLSFICEVKKASPSKGLIAPDFDYLKIAGEYEAAGAAAVSVLTEPDFFLGSNGYLKEIAAKVGLPVLRKDFVIDEYQIFEAKLLGASAVLLICALYETHTKETLQDHIGLTHDIGLSALTEVHSERELEAALNAGAEIIGINNRDLQTFNVSLETTGRLCPLIPSGKLVVSESGIKTKDDITYLASHNVDAVLIGESMMRTENKKKYLDTLKAAAR